MNKLFTFALAIAVCLGTTAMLTNGRRSARRGRVDATHDATSAATYLEADGAFRDGVFVGRLAAESGHPLRPEIARWSGERDRALFVAGYRRGYNDSLVRATLAGNRRD